MSGYVVIHSVSSWLPLTETWLYTQLASLPPDIEAHIVCNTDTKTAQFSLPNIHSYMDVRGLWLFADRLSRKVLNRRQPGFWYRQAKKLKPAIWHSHFADQAWYDREVVEACGAKHVLSVYGADISQVAKVPPWNQRIPEVLKKIDLVLCEGPAMARQVIALGCPPERVKVQHLGIPLERIPFRPRQWEPGTPLKVLIAGTFREKKGIPYALEALAQLSGVVEIDITLIGEATTKPGDADEKAQIMEILENRGLMLRTRLLGFQPYSELLAEGLKNHIFLSPSVQAADGDNEGGSPVVITEMAASGMMIVSSRHCDVPEVIIDGVGGLLAEERDVQGLSDHLLWLVNNPDRWISMQQAARTHIELEYDALTQGKRLAEIYATL